MSDDMAREHAKGTADSLRAYLACVWDDDTKAQFEAEHGNARYIPNAYDWATDVLDVKRTYDSNGELCSVELLVGFGGPNVWATFNGEGCEIRVTWWSAPVIEWVYCPEFSAEMLEVFDDWQINK